MVAVLDVVPESECVSSFVGDDDSEKDGDVVLLLEMSSVTESDDEGLCVAEGDSDAVTSGDSEGDGLAETLGDALAVDVGDAETWLLSESLGERDIDDDGVVVTEGDIDIVFSLDFVSDGESVMTVGVSFSQSTPSIDDESISEYRHLSLNAKYSAGPVLTSVVVYVNGGVVVQLQSALDR